MSKDQFVTRLAEKIQSALGRKFTEEDANHAAKCFIETLQETLAAGENMRFPGFGLFKVVNREATRVKNPRNGELMQVGPSRHVNFKTGAILKRALNGEVVEVAEGSQNASA